MTTAVVFGNFETYKNDIQLEELPFDITGGGCVCDGIRQVYCKHQFFRPLTEHKSLNQLEQTRTERDRPREKRQ